MKRQLYLLCSLLFLSYSVMDAQKGEQFINIESNTESKGFSDLDLIGGWSFNFFPGDPSKYLSPGNGFQLRCFLETKKEYLLGFGVNSYVNDLKLDYSFIGVKEKVEHPAFASISLLSGKRFSKFDGLIEIGYMVQNVVKLEPEDKLKDYQVRGVTAGLSVHVPAVFRIKPTQFYLSNDKEYLFGVNFHGGVKYNLFSYEELNGLMLEVGVGMRLHRDM